MIRRGRTFSECSVILIDRILVVEENLPLKFDMSLRVEIRGKQELYLCCCVSREMVAANTAAAAVCSSGVELHSYISQDLFMLVRCCSYVKDLIHLRMILESYLYSVTG